MNIMFENPDGTFRKIGKTDASNASDRLSAICGALYKIKILWVEVAVWTPWDGTRVDESNRRHFRVELSERIARVILVEERKK